MKDKQARVLAIVALVFMGIFIVALIATFIDHTLFNGGVGFIALGAGVMTLMIFIALKADGRGYSLTKMKNDIEMEEIERAIQKRLEEEQARKQSDITDEDAERSDTSQAESEQSEDTEDKTNN